MNYTLKVSGTNIISSGTKVVLESGMKGFVHRGTIFFNDGTKFYMIDGALGDDGTLFSIYGDVVDKIVELKGAE